MDYKYLEKLNSIIYKIKQNKNELMAILLEFSTKESAEYEINSSIRVLEQAQEELRHMNRDRVEKIVVFHPSNSILYSYILYAVIPSFYCKSIFLRPSTLYNLQTFKIHDFFKKDTDLKIVIESIGYAEFKKKTSDADVVVFTGNYYNSISLEEDYPNALILFFGSGINPFVIEAGTDIEYCARKAVDARLYNSGQDCMCPDLFFVHRSQTKSFVKCLLQQLTELKETGRMNDKVKNNNYEEVALQASLFLSDYQERLVYGGQVDLVNKWIEPSVLVFDIEDMPRCEEHFAPIFNVVSYHYEDEVYQWLTDAKRLESSFGVSVFGNSNLSKQLEKYYTVSLDKTLFDVECGNLPFGGYGPRASYVNYKGYKQSRPILISKEVSRLFNYVQS